MMVGKPGYSANWRRDTFGYIAEHRMEILADLIDLLEKHRQFDLPPMTRCPEFETMVLQAFCRDTDEYSNVVKLIAQNKDDLAKQIEEIIRFKLIDLKCQPDENRIFIRSEVINSWFRRESIMEGRQPVQTIRNLANIGLMPIINKRKRKYPTNGPNQRQGILWEPAEFSEDNRIIIIGRTGNNQIGIVW